MRRRAGSAAEGDAAEMQGGETAEGRLGSFGSLLLGAIALFGTIQGGWPRTTAAALRCIARGGRAMLLPDQAGQHAARVQARQAVQHAV
jgi:hypothetical protein